MLHCYTPICRVSLGRSLLANALFNVYLSLPPQGHCYELHVFVSKREQFNTVRSAKAPGHLTDVTVDTDWVPAAAPNDWKDDAG